MAWTIEWLRQLGNEGALRNAAGAVEAPRRSEQDADSVLRRVANSTARTRVEAGCGAPRDESRRFPMECPIDSADLLASDRLGIEIDYCPTCRGVWLDCGELDKIIERNAVDTERGSDDERRGGVSGRKTQIRTREGFLGELFELGG
jgi:Zn-finger nucleic acid-binding protein